MASIQDEFDDQEQLYVNFARGLQVVRGGAVYLRDYPSNPFVSLIEKRADRRPPLTIFGSGSHGAVRNQGPLREVIAPPMWLQVIHGSNLMNDIQGRRIAPARFLHLFDMDLGLDAHPARLRVLVEGSRSLLAAVPRTIATRATPAAGSEARPTG